MESPFSLKDKTILVSGGTSGIGLAICQAIDALGGKVIIIGRDFSKMESFPFAQSPQQIKFDLSDLEGIASVTEQIPAIDGFVHSAGIMEHNLITFFKPALYENIRKINLDSFLYLINALLKKKKLKTGASVVAISSVSSLVGAKGLGIYGMTKASLNIAVKTFANELSNKKIRVNAVAPGMVKTHMAERVAEEVGEEQIKEDEKRYPLGYSDPEDVANPVAFLLSDAAKRITGEILVIDGGLTAVV